MKRVWKRSLCRLLILAMFVGSFQSNGLAVHAAEKAAALTGSDVDDTGDIATSRQDAEDTKEDEANELIGIDSYGDSAGLTIETETDTSAAAEMDKMPLTMQDDPSTVENLRTSYQNAYVKISDYDVVTEVSEAAPYLVFKGAVEGQTLDASWDKEFYIWNAEEDKSISNINVTITDAGGEAYQDSGSASHFKWTLEKTELSAGTDKKAKLVIGPQDTSRLGVYRANVCVTANEIVSINFEVTWVVAKKLTVSAPSVEETSGLTGQKRYEVELKAEGAGIYRAYDGVGVLQPDDSAYYVTYGELTGALGVTASQAVTWYVRVKDDDENDTKLVSLAQAFNELGINKDDGFTTNDLETIRANIGDDHMIEIAGSENANNSTYNKLTSDDLAGGGTYEFTAVAQVNEVKMNYGPGTIVIPAQTAEMDVTLNITPGKDVYVLYDYTDTDGVDSPDNYWGTSRTLTVPAHNTTAGAERVVPEYKKVTGFDFRDLAEGYAENKVSRRFVINNEVNSNLYYQIKTLNADKESPSDAFLINSFTDSNAVLYPSEYYGENTDYLRAANISQENWTAGVMNNNGYFDLCLKNGLPAGKYSGWLVIEGSGFETIEIPLSASVSPGKYSITLRDDPCKGLESDSFTFRAKASPDMEPFGPVWAFVDGNRPLNILRTAELDNNGQEIVDEGRRKLKVGTSSDQTFIESTNIMDTPDHEAEKIDPARDVDAPYAETDDYAVLPIIVKDGSTPGEYSTTLRVWYDDLNVEGGQSYKDIKINYVLFNDNVDATVTVTPEQPSFEIVMGNVEEGYNVAENSVEFTVSVSGDPDPVNALYGLDVAINADFNDKFIIEGVKPDKIMPGGSAKFTIKPLENLPAGTYRPVVTFAADNLKKPIERKLKFVVTASETFSTYAVADETKLYDDENQYGWTLEDGFKPRLETALQELASINAEEFKVSGTSLVDDQVTPSTITVGNVSQNTKGFLVNLNDNDDDDYDVMVYDNNGILTVTKLITCNVHQYETVLENSNFVAGSQSFHNVSFKVLETVDLDLEDVWEDLVEARNGGVIVDGVDLGPADGSVFRTWIRGVLDNEEWEYSALQAPKFRFLVPYGQTFNKAQEKISYGKYATGLPYMNIATYSDGRYLEGFLYTDAASQNITKLTGTTTITNDVYAEASWHSHTYPQPLDGTTYVGDGKGVKWTWVGDKENGYTEAYVTLTCVDPNGCPDEAGGKKVLTAVVTPEKMSGYYRYQAKVTFDSTKGTGFNNVTYVSENSARHEVENPDRYKWVYDWTETGVTVYNIRDLNAAYATVKAYFMSGNQIVDEKTVSCDKVEFYETWPKVEFYGTRPTCEEPGSGYYHFIFLSSDIPAEDIENGLNVVIRYAAEVQPLGHKWKVEKTDWEGNFDTGATGATMHLVCENDAAHKADLTITKDNIKLVTEDTANQTRTYRAVGNKDGQTLEDEITYTSKPDHEHEWTVSFNWRSVSYYVADTKVVADAYCKVGCETVPATDLTLTNKMVGTTIEYTASAKDPDGKVYYSYKNVSKDGVVRDGHAGQVLNGDLVIVGLKEEYPYSGKKITPDFYVMDGDIVLAKGGDYTVKYTNNKNVGEATIEISGKGNYKDKNAVAKFKIYDPFQRAKDEGVTLAAGVKSIAKIKESFVYNGKAQYPATITVNLNTKTKSTLTLTHEGDGVYTNEGDTTVVISVVNNVNKGTAVVAAVGADGKVKTKTFSIKAAEIKSAEIVEGLEAEYSSKGAIPEGLKVTWKNGDEEEVTLTEDQDFTVKYSNNKAVGTGKFKLTGKGNFKDKLESSFAIKPLEVDEIDAVEAFDKVKAGKLKVIVLDKQGFKVPDKKLSVTVLNEEGTAIDGKTKLTAGTKITVVVKSADSASVVIAEDGISKDAVVGTKMGSVKVDAKKLTKTYTGEAIELTEEDMGSVIVTIKKTPLVYGEDFVIIGYANNVEKGSMTVTIAGTGEDNGRGVFSGTKTFKVKIVPKSMQ